ncbi:urea-proton symporter DUR3-like [Panicum miliaceum]|uniref:Urea-proton symporter DUR3-like n=1 Tax=Panicum miliaceum TaxID=4540 RepID=A0A3L6R990_PANMI|nr:urea-proton symporter DUR3-like [Panicum miliaceum]
MAQRVPAVGSSAAGVAGEAPRYVGSLHTSEWFNTAGRSVKTGLIACVIISQWTWEATILQSSNVAGRYGVAGPFWHASGATVQVLLFGAIAIEVKREAPSAHSDPPVEDRQVGPAGHGRDRCALAGGEVQLAPATSPCGRRYGVAIAWGTVGSAVIIVLPLVGSWGTICKVCAGMFTSDGVYERLDEVNLRLKAIMVAMPEAEKRYQQMQQDQQNTPWRRRTWPPPPMAQTKMMILQLQR